MTFLESSAAAAAEVAAVADRHAPNLVADPATPELLRIFNSAGVLAPADVHTAVRLGRLGGEADEGVLLAVALAVRGPRVGHVSVDLARIRSSIVVGEEDVDLEGLPWPVPTAWLGAVAASPLVRAGDGSDGLVRPLRLSGTALYLDRYRRDEVALGDDLLVRAGQDGAGRVGGAGQEVGAGDLERLFPGAGSADQRVAAAAAATRRLSVIAGGPGTGKTTTVARLLALLGEQAWRRGTRPPLVALAAPTGKAAARMEEAVRDEADRLDTAEEVKQMLRALTGTTIHRLLGTRPDRPGKFRHHRGHRLPHDIVIVDEASMVSLSLMARLVEAVRPDARLVLVGDPEQLVSVEAGAVLADIVSPASDRPHGDGSGGEDRAASPMAGAVRLLRTNHRFAGSLARLAEAIRSGDADGTVALLRNGGSGRAAVPVGGAGDEVGAVGWVDTDNVGADPAGSAHVDVLDRLVAWARAVQEAAAAGDATGALTALRGHRVLCAHRDGPAGVVVWNRWIESRLAAVGPGARAEAGAGTGGRPDGSAGGPGPGAAWYPGRPVLVTANDYGLRLYNGDTGIAVAASAPSAAVAASAGVAALRVVFDAGPTRPAREYSPSRLAAIETVFAMTVHKSQGSEFDGVTLLLPDASSRLLTRELLYTAVTRARRQILVIGTEAAIRQAVGRRVARASGLAERLWGGSA